jgi:hypothetical protein
MKPVLALDLASVSGWAVGEPGMLLAHGSIRFATKGASHEAIFANAWDWMSDKLSIYGPTTVVWEAPLITTFAKRGTNVDTTTILYGLPAVIGACAYKRGIYDIRKAETRLVRQHFIGQNPRRQIAKKMVIQQCIAQGWDITDDNEADALATWSYMSAIMRPDFAMRPTPLFMVRGAR